MHWRIYKNNFIIIVLVRQIEVCYLKKATVLVVQTLGEVLLKQGSVLIHNFPVP